ncbi:MAG: hypothetical protein IIC29_06210, partial [Chloroflexi bacterium]|nr:hypothetical protein [Chloroflexota bacterium]
MPVADFHLCEIVPLDAIEAGSLTTRTGLILGRPVEIVSGKLVGAGIVDQSTRFPLANWPEADARNVCKSVFGIFEVALVGGPEAGNLDGGTEQGVPPAPPPPPGIGQGFGSGGGGGLPRAAPDPTEFRFLDPRDRTIRRQVSEPV